MTICPHENDKADLESCTVKENKTEKTNSFHIYCVWATPWNACLSFQKHLVRQMHIAHENFEQQWSNKSGLQCIMFAMKTLCTKFLVGIYTAFIYLPQQIQLSDCGLKKKFRIGYPLSWQWMLFIKYLLNEVYLQKIIKSLKIIKPSYFEVLFFLLKFSETTEISNDNPEILRFSLAIG